MKNRIWSIIFVCCILEFNENSIVNGQSLSIENEVGIFFRAVEQFDYFFNDSLGWQKEFTDEEVLDISQKWYRAIYKSPVEYDLFFHQLHAEWEIKVVAAREKYLIRRPGLQLGRLNRKLTEYTTRAYTELLRVPYLFRVKVKKFGKSPYQSKSMELKTSQTDMIVIIEDIIKGEEYFNIGDSLMVSFFGAWFHGAREEQYFKVDATYFLPVGLFRIEDRNNFQYKIHMLPDNNFAVYPIIGEMVETPGDFFGVGETSNWEDFKRIIKEKFIIQ